MNEYIDSVRVNALSPLGLYRLARGALTRGDMTNALEIVSGQERDRFPNITIRIGWRSLHIVQGEALARKVIEAIDDQRLEKPPFMAKVLSLFGGIGIPSAASQLWRDQRDIFEPAFHTTQQMTKTIQAEAQALMEKWKSQGGTDNLVKDVKNYVLKAHCRGVLDFDLADGEGDEKYTSFAKAIELYNRYGIYFAVLQYIGVNTAWITERIPGIAGARREIRKATLELIAAKSEQSPEADPVAKILRRENWFSSPTPRQKHQAGDEIASLLSTGVAPAAPISHTIAQLAADPFLQEKIRQEMASDSSGRACSPSLKELIMRGFVEKPMTPISIPRRATTDIQFDNLKIKKGDLVIINFDSIPPSPERKAGLVFFKGKHICPGRSFSMQLATAITTVLVQHPQGIALISDVQHTLGMNRVSRYGKIKLHDLSN